MWVVRFARSCPFCMYIFRRLIFFPGYQYQFKINFPFSSVYYDLSNVSKEEPLFYNPSANVYIQGTPIDPYLADTQVNFLMVFDRDVIERNYNTLPYPEITGIFNRLVYSQSLDTYDIYYDKKYEVELKGPHDYEAEAKILDRISKILQR